MQHLRIVLVQVMSHSIFKRMAQSQAERQSVTWSHDFKSAMRTTVGLGSVAEDLDFALNTGTSGDFIYQPSQPSMETTQ